MPDTPSAPTWPFLNSDIDTADKSFFGFAKNHYPVGFAFFIVACALAAIDFVLYIVGQPVALLILFPIAIYALAFSTAMNKRMAKDFAQHLASIMGYSFADTAPLASFAGDIFGVGHDKKISDVLSGTYQGFPVRLFQYIFVTGYGKSQQKHEFVIAEISFDHPIPPMRVVQADSTLTEFALDDGAIDAHPSSPMKISLEGDFNKYFSVYAPENTQIEDLEIMSPDFMASLIDHYHGYEGMGFECHDVRLYIHQIDPLNDKKIKDLSAIYSLADILIPKLQQIKI